MKFSDIPAGKYLAKPTRAAAGRSKQKQTPYIEVEFQIPDLECSLRWTGYLTEKTEERTLDTMDLIGWTGDTKFAPGSIDTDREVSITINREVGQDGVERPRIMWVNAAGSTGGGVPMESDESALAGLNLKAKLQARRKVTGSATQRLAERSQTPDRKVTIARDFAGIDQSEEIPF